MIESGPSQPPERNDHLEPHSHLLPLTRESLRIRTDQSKYIFCGRFHVVLLTKFISLLALPFYLALIGFVFYFGNATTVMFSAIFLGSVAAFTINGAFRGSKMCLIPFIFLQSVFFVYATVLFLVCFCAIIWKETYFSHYVTAELISVINSRLTVFGLSLLLLLSLPPIIIVTHIVYLDFLFISELDEALELYRDAQQQFSNDDNSPPMKSSAF